jgi:hypothetical protein
VTTRPEKIVSGGQTGADRAALDAAIELGIETGGWIPKGRLAEDGRIPHRYKSLVECDSADHAIRTELNVRDSDATLIVSRGPLTGGSLLTFEIAGRYGRPVLHVDPGSKSTDEAVDAVAGWLAGFECRVLNVAGPRASGDPDIYRLARELLLRAFTD